MFDRYLINHKFVSRDEFNKHYYLSQKNVYEVVRVIDHDILFWDSHLNRLRNSISMLCESYDLSDILNKVNLVIRENNIDNGNIKIEISFGEGVDLYIYPISFYYPDTKIGVKVVTFNIERNNPTVKSYDHNFKKRVQEVIDENDVYEILMVNRDGFITEGSRTNIYFVHNNKFFTAPDHMVLSGVTRLKVNEIIKELGFELIFESVHIDDIFKFDACFLTSTSSTVLPIGSINGVSVSSDSNELVRKVSSVFEKNLK